MNHYTICHLSRYLSISHVVFHTFIQMLLLSEIMSGNEISMNYFPCAEAETVPGDHIKSACVITAHYLEFVNRESLHAALRSTSELCNSNSIMCLFEK